MPLRNGTQPGLEPTNCKSQVECPTNSATASPRDSRVRVAACAELMKLTPCLCEGVSDIHRHRQVRAERAGRPAAGRRRRRGNPGQQEPRPVAVSDVGPPGQTRVGSTELPGCQVRGEAGHSDLPGSVPRRHNQDQ